MIFELKDWHIDYAQSIAKYANNKKIADNLRNAFPYPYSLENAKAYISDCIEGDNSNRIVKAIVIDGEAVGSIGVFIKDDVYEKSAEIGYWLAEEFWGKGIISSAVIQVCEIAFKTFDIVRIFAEIFAYNIGSQKVLEKSGFALEGIKAKSVYKNGKIFDSCIYALIKEESDINASWL